MSVIRLRSYRCRRYRLMYFECIIVASVLGIIVFVASILIRHPYKVMTFIKIKMSSIKNGYISDNSPARRKLLTSESESEYPAEIFTEDQLKHGYVAFHFIGVLYMFMALAIVCDEFFVPSLGVITKRLDISEDVAGATFMAAGGSAPELFTSLIGTFFSKNDVGIGTIVGSAVFNILFVIGMCSFASKTILHLTWWPLFRDVMFYSVSLMCLIAFFHDNSIKPYESAILFACYIAYVLFMRYNEIIEFKTKSLLRRLGIMSKEQKEDSFHCSSLQDKQSRASHTSHVSHMSARKHRSSIVEIMMPDEHHHSHAANEDKRSTISSNISNNYDDERKMDDGSRSRRGMSIRPQSQEQSKMPSPVQVGSRKSSNSSIGSRGTQQSAIATSNVRSNTTAEKGKIGESDVKSEKDGTYPNIDDHSETSSKRKSGESKPREQSHLGDVIDEEELPLDLTFPSTFRQRVTYIFLFPILIVLWLTLPDVRRDTAEKFFVISFFGSIIWIGGFSFCMVWWVNTFAETIGVPVEIMGITLLAAGTSVPDLITSVIVAKKGFGDMAVSSSVGSNIFDITVGLPVPWLLKAAVDKGKSYSVSSKGLFCSIVLLFGMLIAVIVSIAASGWKMKKALGVVMMLLYLVFITFAILLTKDIIKCDNVY